MHVLNGINNLIQCSEGTYISLEDEWALFFN